MTNILITSAGQRVSLVRAFQKEIKQLDAKNKVYTVDYEPMLAPACIISDGYRKVPLADGPSYIHTLLNVCKEWDIKIIIPTIDTELLTLAENKQLFSDNGINLIVSSLDFVKKCRDKRLTNRFFTENNIDTPKIYDKQNLLFPLFVKPYDGSASKNTFIIKNPSQICDYQIDNPKLIFMEYIDNSIYDEFTIDAYYDKNSTLKCLVPRKRISVRAGEISKGVTQKNEIMNFIKTHLEKISGAIGCLTMQFFFNPDSKRIIGIEINPRFGGGYPLSYLAGANYPKYIIEEYILNLTLNYWEDWENNLLMLRYDDEILVRNYEK